MNKNFYKSIVDRSPFGYAWHEIIIDQKGKPIDYRFLEVNEAFERLTGLKSTEIIGKTVREIIPDILSSEFDWIDCYGSIAISGGSNTFEQYSEALGRWYKVQVYSPEKNHFVTIFEDITGQKKHDEALKKSENNLKNFFNADIDFNWVLDEEGIIIAIDDTIRKKLGYADEELIGHSIIMVHPPELRKKASEVVKSILEGNEQYCSIPIMTKQGSLIPVETYVVKGNWDGKPALFATSKDISALKLSQKELMESEAKFRSITENAFDMICLIDLKGNYLYCNAAYESILGYKPDELIGTNAFEIIHSDDKKTIEPLLSNGLKNKTESESFTIRLFDKSGNCKWVEHRATLMLDKENIPGRILILANDITDRKLTHDALKQSEQKYKHLQELFRNMADILPDMIWAKDLDRKYIFVNKSICQNLLNAKDTDEPIGKDDMFFANRERESHPDNPDWHSFGELCCDSDSIVLESKMTQQFDEFGNVKGEFLFLDVVKAPLRNENGEIIGVVGAAKDVTQRKQAERLLIESEERFRSLVESSTDGISILDFKGNITFVNKQKCELFKANNEIELTGLNWFNLITKTDRQKVYALTDDLFKKGILKNIEAEMVRLDGSTFPAELNFRLLKDTIENPVRIMSTIRDITDRKRAEEQISKLSQAVEQSPASVVITNLKGEIEYVNPTFSVLTGYSYEEAYMKNPRILKSGDVPENVYKELWSTITSGNDWRGEFHNKKKNGEFYWELASISPIRNSYGKITHYLAVKEDITDRKQIERELISAKEKAEESNRLKSAFLANMSHEIRTPMNGILGFAELLKKPKLTGAEQQEYICIIEKSGARMLNIINDLMNISKVDSGLMDIVYSDINIIDLLDFMYNFFNLEARQKGLLLAVHSPAPSRQTIIKSDKEKIYAILTNLIKNALKFTKKGRIDFGYVRKNGSFEFFVKDSGIGISPQFHQVVFERFIQGDMGLSREYEGVGLGLSISKAYVEMLGGEIWMESELGVGTKFFFTIPAIDEINELEDSIEKPAVVFNDELPLVTILIAEDDDASLMYFLNILKDSPFKLLQATTGQEAVDLCKENPQISLILMDIKMPEMDGYVAARLIKQFRPELAIIAQTAYALPTDKDIYSDVFDDYIIKPIKADVLKQKINKYLSKV